MKTVNEMVSEMSRASRPRGKVLLDMLEHYGVFGIRDLSNEQIEKYYKGVFKK